MRFKKNGEEEGNEEGNEEEREEDCKIKYLNARAKSINSSIKSLSNENTNKAKKMRKRL